MEENQIDSPISQSKNLSSSQIYEEDAQLQQTSKDLLQRQEEIIRQFETKLSKTMSLVKQNCSFSLSNENQVNNYEGQKYEISQQYILGKSLKPEKSENQYQYTQSQYQNKKNELDNLCIPEESEESNQDQICQECSNKENVITNLKEKITNLENRISSKEKEIEKEKSQNTRKYQELKKNNDQLLMTIEDKYKLSFEIQKQKYEEKFQELLQQLNQREKDSAKKITEITTKNKKLYNLVVQLELEKSELNTKCQEIAAASLQPSSRVSSRSSKPVSNQIPRYKTKGTIISTPKRKNSINLSHSKLIITSNKKGVNNSLFTPNENNQNLQNQISEIDITASVLQESTSTNNNIMNLMNNNEKTVCQQTKTINNFSAKKQKKNVSSAHKFVKEKTVVNQPKQAQNKVKKYKQPINQKV